MGFPLLVSHSLSLSLSVLLSVRAAEAKLLQVTICSSYTQGHPSGVKLYDYRGSKSPGDFNRLAEASRKRYQDSWQANAVSRHESLSIACVF